MQATQPINEEPPPGSLLKRFLVGRNPKRTLVRAAVLAVAAVITFRFILLPIRVTGISMEPTYHDKTVNIINRVAYFRSKPKRGDVVGAKMSNMSKNVHVMLLKRIIALPGETVVIRRGTVYVDGEALEERYLQNQQPWDEEPGLLKPDEYYLIGDNRSMPKEQHDHGKAEISQIVGKIIW